VVAFLRARSRADLVAYGLVVVLVVIALAGPPLLHAMSARVRVTVHVSADASRNWDRLSVGSLPKDPWGADLVDVPPPLRSCGPDGRDDGGTGDDVPLLPGDSLVMAFWRFGAEVFFTLAVALAVCWEVGRIFFRTLRAERGTLHVELVRCALLAIGPTLVLVVLVLLLARLTGSGDELAKLGEGLVVPLKVALPASIYMATFAALLAFRLRPPAE
jgi:hypothetical protein